MGIVFGYARVSTDDQDMALQVAALEKYGVQHIFSEHASGKTMERKSLKRVIKVMRSGDTLVVWKLDRLGRTLPGVLEMIEQLNKDNINLVSLTESFDTTSPMGKAFLQIALVFAELERNMISQRTKAGMAARKAADPSVKWGAKHFLSDFPERMKHVQGLYNAGEFSLEDRPSEKNPDAVIVKGMTAASLMAEVNAINVKAAKKVGNAETIRRWLRDGAPGLVRSTKEENSAMQKAFERGQEDWRNNKFDNPYPSASPLHDYWEQGQEQARSDHY